MGIPIWLVLGSLLAFSSWLAVGLIDRPLPSAETFVSTESASIEVDAVSSLMMNWMGHNHWWNTTDATPPPSLTRSQQVLHGPMVASQAGKTRPYLGSKNEASWWTQFVRRLAVIDGPGLFSFKGFENGVMDKMLSGIAIPKPPPCNDNSLDGGSAPDIVVSETYTGGDENTESNNVLYGGTGSTNFCP